MVGQYTLNLVFITLFYKIAQILMCPLKGAPFRMDCNNLRCKGNCVNFSSIEYNPLKRIENAACMVHHIPHQILNGNYRDRLYCDLYMNGPNMRNGV